VFCEILQIVISAALNVFTQFTRPIISAALGDRPHSTYVPVIERSRDDRGRVDEASQAISQDVLKG
jgi:hypothetical protein